MASWREQESDTQARLREDNESTARAGGPAGGETSSFRCECGDRRCWCTIRLTVVEYESVRAHATRFVIARDHENPESQQVIEEHERFAVVDTVSGEAVKLARRSYPRQWRPPQSTEAPPARLASVSAIDRGPRSGYPGGP